MHWSKSVKTLRNITKQQFSMSVCAVGLNCNSVFHHCIINKYTSLIKEKLCWAALNRLCDRWWHHSRRGNRWH